MAPNSPQAVFSVRSVSPWFYPTTEIRVKFGAKEGALSAALFRRLIDEEALRVHDVPRRQSTYCHREKSAASWAIHLIPYGIAAVAKPPWP